MGAGEDDVGWAIIGVARRCPASGVVAVCGGTAVLGEVDVDDGEEEAAVFAEEAVILRWAIGVLDRDYDVMADEPFEQRVVGAADGADDGGAGRLGAARLRFHSGVPSHGGGGVGDGIFERVEPVAGAAGEASMEAGAVGVAEGLVAAAGFLGGEGVEEADEAEDAIVFVAVDQVGVAGVGVPVRGRGRLVIGDRRGEDELQAANLGADAAFELFAAEEIEPDGVATPLAEAGVALPRGDHRGQDGSHEDDEDRDEEGAVQHVVPRLRVGAAQASSESARG